MSVRPDADQLANLWAFARGDTAPLEFERWFLGRPELESWLDPELHWDLMTSSYRDQDVVWQLRQRLLEALARWKACECPTLRDLDVVPMGGEVDDDDKFRSDHVFAHFEEIATYGTTKWWLYISRCRVCSTVWLIAQDERIYDDWYLSRESEQVLAAARDGSWPERFSTYEDVLTTGRKLSTPPIFFDANSPALVQTVADLRGERPEISNAELSWLLGVTEKRAAVLRRLSESAS